MMSDSLVRVDLHSHTSRSHDAWMAPSTLVQRARAAAIDRIATELQLLGISARALPSRPISFDHPDLQQLTPREREVLVQIAGGRRVPAMAKKLFISQSTVRNHLRAIYRKLDVESQGELVELLNRL